MGRQVISAQEKQDQPQATLICHLMSYVYTAQIKHGSTIRYKLLMQHQQRSVSKILCLGQRESTVCCAREE